MSSTEHIAQLAVDQRALDKSAEFLSMAIRQTRVFVHHTEPNTDWTETLIGKVFRQVVQEFNQELQWFWFSRYICHIGEPNDDTNDCSFNEIPIEYKQPFPGEDRAGHRSLRFRFEITDADQTVFESRLEQLLHQHGYTFSDIRPYDHCADVGCNRFLGVENRQAGRDVQRARLVIHLCHVISQLVIDTLVGPDAAGRYRLEQNDDPQNPNRSTFESLHHLFCNITQVPVSILVSTDAQHQLLGSFWGQPRYQRQRQWNGETVTEIYLSY